MGSHLMLSASEQLLSVLLTIPINLSQQASELPQLLAKNREREIFGAWSLEDHLLSSIDL